METGDEDQQQQEEQSGASSSGTVAVPTGPPHPNAQGWYGVENPTPACRFSYQFPEYHHPSNKSSHDLRHTYQWDVLLAEPDFVAAPVTAFKHVSLPLNLWTC